MKRDKAIHTINKFPQELELVDLLKKIIFTKKVENGLKQLEYGKTVLMKKLRR